MHYKLTLGVDFALKVSIYLTLIFCFRTKLMSSHQRACTCMRAYVGRDGERERKAYTKRPFICVCVCVRVCGVRVCATGAAQAKLCCPSAAERYCRAGTN